MAYRQALASVLALVAGERVLRHRMVLGALGFAAFSVLWTSLAFLLAGPPFRLGEAAIGLFGLARAAGALAAPLAGRLADRGHGQRGQTVMLSCLLASWGLLALGASSLTALIAGIVVLDFRVQGAQIGNQTAIYSLRAQARSRLTTAYMVSVFLGGIGGSLLSAAAYGAGGWTAVCAFGATLSAAALGVWLGRSGRTSELALREGPARVETR